MNRPEPPRTATRLVQWAIGVTEAAEGILGDLTEEFHARVDARGPRPAARWFWMQALWISVVFRIGGGGIRRASRKRRSMGVDLAEEIAHAGRSLRRAPAFTALSVGILALGIGSATAVFEGFRSVALVDLPVSEPDRIVTLSLNGATGDRLSLVPSEIAVLGRDSRTLASVAGALPGTGTMPLTESDRPLVLDFAFVTSGFFEVLGARPALGRFFGREDGVEGALPVTVVSYGTWQREFGGAPDVLGRRLTATQYQGSYEIVGVAPPGLDYPVGADYWILPGPRRQPLGVVARLAPGATPETARAEFLSLARAIDGERASPTEPATATIQGLTEAVVGDARPILIAMTAAAALLLLIACANVAGLLLMRAARRSRDVMVRRALGASGARLFRAFLIEGALLGAAGGGLGWAFALVLLSGLRQVAPDHVPRSDMIGLAGTSLPVAVGVTLAAVILVAAVPSRLAARSGISTVLQHVNRWASPTRRARTVRRSLVAAQVALAVVVLFGAGLLTRTLQHLGGLPLGYETEGVSVMELGIDRRNLGGPAEVADLLEGVFAQLRSLPGVSSVTPLMARPYTGAGGVFETRPLVEGQTEVEADANPRVPLESGGAEIFQTLGIPVVQGRGFLESDREDATKVVVMSQTLADRLWPERDPVGQRIRLTLGREEWWTVVGVAGETRFRRLREATPTIYLPWRQFQILPMAWTVAVRTDGDPAALTAGMRNAIREYDPRVYVWTVRSLRDHLGQGPLATPRTMAAVLTAFGLSALLLAAIGLYGVMTLSVHEQTRELGIRRALGASERSLRRNVLNDALRTILVGGLLGLGAALTMSRLLAPLLFQVSPADPVTAVGVSVVIVAVGLLAAHVPVRRAMRIDPRIALEAE